MLDTPFSFGNGMNVEAFALPQNAQAFLSKYIENADPKQLLAGLEN